MTYNSVGHLGVVGSYSHQAATALCPDADYKGFKSFQQLVDAVVAGDIDAAILPFENSSSGPIPSILPLIVSTELFIVQEYLQDIDHMLVGVKGASRDEILTVYSHPQGFIQSSRFLAQYLPDVEQEPKSDTASAVRDMIKKGDRTVAAIGSEFAADRYSASVLQAGISNRADNNTRFVLVTKELPDRGPVNMTSIVIQVNHDANALAKALSAFGDADINMIKLETFTTISKMGLPTFYIELACSTDDDRFAAAMEGIKDHISSLKLLGAYQSDPRRKTCDGFLEP